jgi:manganese transport protein
VQSREINLKGDARIQHMLKYEFFDTLFSMLVGWAINSAMIILAASTFYEHGTHVEELSQAQAMLQPLLGNNAANIFAIALLLAGLSSTITSGMAAGSIFSGLFHESYNVKDTHSVVGILLSLGVALLLIFVIGNPFQGLLYSQMFLSIQLPFTVFLQVSLTSSKRVMGKYANKRWNSVFLYGLATLVTILNIWLIIEAIG